MNQSAFNANIYSLLSRNAQLHGDDSLQKYSGYRAEKIGVDLLEMSWENATDGMLITDSDGFIIAVNKAFCTLVMMNEKELLKLPFTVIFDRTVDRKKIFEEYQERIRNNTVQNKNEQRLMLSSGKTLDVEVTKSALTDGAQETYILTEFRDISERKRWEEALNMSEQRYRSIFENSVLPMYQSNLDGKLINANIAFLHLLGYDSFQELLALNLEKDVYVNSEDRMRLYDNLQSGRSSLPMEIDLKKKDQSIITVIPHSRIVYDEEGNSTGFEGALEDITERKQLENKLLTNYQKLEIAQEELSKLNAQKDKLLAMVSHDLRSPFSSILGFCDILKNEFHTIDDSEKLEYIGYINDAAQQQLNLVNSILEWSRIETGRITLQFKPVNVMQVASEILQMMLGLAKKKNISFRSSITSDTAVIADEPLLRQLLLNLIGNALKFTPSGGTISIEMKEDSPSQCIIEVIDTGMGIPPEDMEKLFNVGEKYTRTGLDGEIGTGLGLPMCYEIMKTHHGTIEARSFEGKGTTFTLTFPKIYSTRCKKVLIVDDLKGNRLIHSRFIKRISEDAETLFAETAEKALEILENETPDLILTDYHMPLMNGLEFIDRLRSQRTTKHVPVILISGAEMGPNGVMDPMTKVLRKPVVFSELQKVIESLKF